VVELLPVDGEGVWLPGEDFSQKQKESYPCLAGIDRRPIQPVGHPWGDARVVDGASIAAALLPVWQPLKLYRIQAGAEKRATPTLPYPAGGSGAGGEASAGPVGVPTYELYTRAGTRIIWGTGIKSAAAGEPATADKVAWLVQFAAAHGSLDVGPSLDVRRLPPAKVAKQ
jgi:hypothetical protein